MEDTFSSVRLPIFAFLFCLISLQFGGTNGQITYPTPTDFKNFLINEPYKSYNKYIFPRINQADSVNVSVNFFLIAITAFDELNGQLSSVGYYTVQWDNQILTWTASQSNMDNMLIGQDNFWRPNLVIANSVDKLMEMGHTSYRVRIEMNGTHEWLVGAISKTACSVDVTYYPFDRQTCSVILTSWGYTPSQVRLQANSTEIDLTHFKRNVEWELTSTTVESDETGTYPQLIFKINLKRRPVFFLVNMVVPILILGMLNSFVFLLPPESGERVGYAMTAFLTFAVFLTMVSEGLPKASQPMSQLSYFLSIMLVLSSMSTFFTLMTLRIFHMDEESRVPRCLRLFAAFLMCDTCKHKFCKEEKPTKKPRDDPDADGELEDIEDVEEEEDEDDDELTDEERAWRKDYTKHVDWKTMAQVIDVLLFFIFMLGTSGVAYYFLAPLFAYASL